MHILRRLSFCVPRRWRLHGRPRRRGLGRRRLRDPGARAAAGGLGRHARAPDRRRGAARRAHLRARRAASRHAHLAPDLPRRFARRRRALGGEQRALAAVAPGASGDPRARHHHRRPRAPDRSEPAHRLRHARRRNQVYDDDHMLEGPLPAVAIGAVVEEEITVRDEKPFFAGGSVFREYVGRAGAGAAHAHRHRRAGVAAAQARHAPAAECAGQGVARQWPRALDASSRARSTKCARWRRTCRRTRRPGRAWSSRRAPRGKRWPAVYRGMTEARIRNDDARPLIAGLKAPRERQPQKRLEYIAQGRRAPASRGALHRRRVRRRAADPRISVRDAAPPLRRLQGQVHVAGGGAARLGHRRLPGAALRRRRPGRVARTAGPRHVRSRHRVRAGRRRGGADLWIDATAEYARVGTLPAQDTDRLRADHPRRARGADAHARAALGATTARSRRANSSSPNTARRA